MAIQKRYDLEKVNIEVERMFLAKLRNPTDLNKAASVTRIEQWEIRSEFTDSPVPGGGVMRVRCYDGKSYEMCIKRFSTTDSTKALEKEFKIDEETFKMFRALAPIGTIKRRFIFPIKGTDLKWEVDTYETRAGVIIPWVKVDLETSAPTGKLPEFPLDVELMFECFLDGSQFGTMTEAQKKKKEFLFNKVFQLRNEKCIGTIELGDREVDGVGDDEIRNKSPESDEAE